ncbi:hypothetical protein U0070_014812 [Myodes glareolus]|uniref:Uncharacterized protein n=1 Tax=Myodes glareolus TaxID=447135 RepID=A0AAW0JEZ4_MYOGA
MWVSENVRIKDTRYAHIASDSGSRPAMEAVDSPARVIYALHSCPPLGHFSVGDLRQRVAMDVINGRNRKAAGANKVTESAQNAQKVK